MSDFHQFAIELPLTPSSAMALLARAFPDVRWRKGDSDAQGPYVSGRSGDGVRMKAWLGEEPPVLTVSFDSFASEAADRAEQVEQRLAGIKDVFSRTVAPISLLNGAAARSAPA